MTKTTERKHLSAAPAIIAIDPGISGGIAALAPDGSFFLVRAMPTNRKKSGRNEVDVAWLYSVLSAMREGLKAPPLGVIELVSAMPGQGVSGMFSLGDSFGSARALLTILCHEVLYVAPGKWKKAMGLNKDKAYSLTVARRMFPDAREHISRKKDEGLAEALLLARYAQTTTAHVAP